MFVDSEMLTFGHGYAVYENSIKAWRPPHANEEITAEDRQRIIDDIRGALAFKNERLNVI